ncbi:MAG: HRDC domain-containing protein [Acidimicrobiales bacterium]|nr:HRDC domain-containing protein [Acidimicrobiales bacterium]
MGRGRASGVDRDGAVTDRSGLPAYRWIDDQREFDAFLGAAASTPTYALDTEFHRERTYYAHLALLQLAAGDDIVVVDPLAVDVAPLRGLLDSDSVCLMHASSQDLEILERSCGTVPRHLVDTQVAAGFVGLGSPGLGVLLQRRLGVNLPKADRLTDWLRRPLREEARVYAATDVAYLDQLWASLRDELEKRGRLAWALDECDEIRRRHREPADPELAWWRIKEARRLKGRARGVAQEVAAWRERRARHLDRPVRHVLPDLAVVAIAERPPRSRNDLSKVRGLDGRHLKAGAAEDLMSAVRSGVDLPERELRLPPRDGVDSTFRPAVTLASAWVSQLSRDAALDASLVATRADIEGLVRGDDSSRLLSGWRADVAGLPVKRLLEGTAALAFEGEGRLVLEARSHQPPPGVDDVPSPGPSGSDG